MFYKYKYKLLFKQIPVSAIFHREKYFGISYITNLVLLLSRNEVRIEG